MRPCLCPVDGHERPVPPVPCTGEAQTRGPAGQQWTQWLTALATGPASRSTCSSAWWVLHEVSLTTPQAKPSCLDLSARWNGEVLATMWAHVGHRQGHRDVHRDDSLPERGKLCARGAGASQQTACIAACWIGSCNIAKGGFPRPRRVWRRRSLCRRRSVASPVARRALGVARRAPNVTPKVQDTAGQLQAGGHPLADVQWALWGRPMLQGRAALILVLRDWWPWDPRLRQATRDLVTPLKLQALEAWRRRQRPPAAHAAAVHADPRSLLLAAHGPPAAHAPGAGTLAQLSSHGGELPLLGVRAAQLRLRGRLILSWNCCTPRYLARCTNACLMTPLLALCWKTGSCVPHSSVLLPFLLGWPCRNGPHGLC
mmetsp:Transcript_13875/g.43460  ORF Transcript_13875/g.43460 Transcript_13875/m.43460 type:complete len:371 (-) Transcript_13875:802-1914(-)